MFNNSNKRTYLLAVTKAFFGLKDNFFSCTFSAFTPNLILSQSTLLQLDLTGAKLLNLLSTLFPFHRKL